VSRPSRTRQKSVASLAFTVSLSTALPTASQPLFQRTPSNTAHRCLTPTASV